MVMAAVARRGMRDIHVAASSIFAVHAPLVEHIRSGVVTRISSAFVSGPGRRGGIARGCLPTPLVLTTHGGRARMLEAGELAVDVAFVAAPAADAYGNISGRLGRASCGALGYPMADVEVRRHVVAVTDSLLPYPVPAIDIPQHLVDFVVEVPEIGDPAGILSGTTRPAEDATSLAIAETAAAVIAGSGLLVEGFSFQTGAGGVSLATAAAVSGGCSRAASGAASPPAASPASTSRCSRRGFSARSSTCSASTLPPSSRSAATRRTRRCRRRCTPTRANRGPVVNMLDAVILGAAEIDLDFNVNVTTEGQRRHHGRLRRPRRHRRRARSSRSSLPA